MSVAEVVDAISDASIASPNASSASPAPWARLASRYSASASPTRSPSARATTRAWSANWRDAPGSLSRHAAASSSSCRTRTDVDFSSAELACESADTNSQATWGRHLPCVARLRILGRCMSRIGRRSRQLESAAVTAFLPVAALVPFWLVALVIIWLPLRLVWDIPFWVLPATWLALGSAVVRPPRAGRGADAAARCTAARSPRARHHRSGVDLAGGPQRPAAGRFRRADPAVERAQRVRLRRPPRRRDVVRRRAPDAARARRRARPRAEPPPRHAHRGADARPLVVAPDRAVRALRLLPAERRPRRDRQLRRPLVRPDRARTRWSERC